jgi:hypothetical protein
VSHKQRIYPGAVVLALAVARWWSAVANRRQATLVLGALGFTLLAIWLATGSFGKL